ncbi:hypothetical protein [Thermococcus sp. Bubb.Bath]|uniref:hypothetical protein n=1 Tax=Thermococcus sp. Bubb.Bath TaxID=1638242 RepID=UPI00143A14B8|nr:hypothetical protein [Thermococcus sp. Bubb.Bath]NJF24839.1 hypothetical protein [Thermococcus sp. Bubb.Bath]
MVELDFELPLKELNGVMERFMSAELFTKWVLYNEDRGTVALRVVVPDFEMEQVILDIAEVVRGPLEISIVKDGLAEIKVDQAFINVINVDGVVYPLALIMEFDFNAHVPSRIELITEKDCPEEVISAILHTKLGPFDFRDPMKTKILQSNKMTKIMLTTAV